MLVLESIGKIKSPQFVEFYLLFEDEFLKMLQDGKLTMKIVLTLLQVYQDKGYNDIHIDRFHDVLPNNERVHYEQDS